ncbi:MAG: adenosylmethionine--8-amino-7-oxononanoate transaminase [Gammaproteobacteria bacterium]|nr:adenosylmethionine--8-amino-7-oxononanoate transaminase [Gammaproteobacteria bacterium]
MKNIKLVQRDLNVVWHPCTQMKDHEALPPIPIRRGAGVWLEDFEGNRYLDAISSWWVNLFGHNHPFINRAVIEQLESLEHIILAGFTHEPVVFLSERLVEVTPPGLSRCFYAENGSAAVEIALKMSFHYWRNCGFDKKTEFVNLANSYHGETLGALAIGDVDLYKNTYAPLLMGCRTAPSPDCYERSSGENWEAFSRRRFKDMELLLEEHANTLCAVIVEPLVQCAGGMRMYHPVYLSLLRDACHRYQIHLIADECAVGFGRTGTLFACEQAGISPDFMCLAKGLTGGYLPLSAVLTTESVFEAFYDDYETHKAFLHSHSYTGNPLGCAAALASLELFNRHDTVNANRELSAAMAHATAHFAEHPHVAEVRQSGMILAVELVKNKSDRTPYPWQERRGLRVYRDALKHGVLLRPLGNVVYFMPPYVIQPDEIDLMANVAWRGIQIAVND